MKVIVHPSLMMGYVYETDAKGAKDAGWKRYFASWKGKERRPYDQRDAERSFPRQPGIRCDEEAVVAHFVVGDEPAEVIVFRGIKLTHW